MVVDLELYENKTPKMFKPIKCTKNKRLIKTNAVH